MAPADEIPCREIVELITQYLDDALPADERARFEAHLATCDPCTAVVEEFRLTIKAVGAIGPDQLSVEDRDRLLNLFRTWRAS